MNFNLFQETTTFEKNGKYYDSIIQAIKTGFSDFSPEGITSYLSFRYPIFNLSMFNGISKIPIGYKLKNNNLIKRWYPDFTIKEYNFINAVKKTEFKLIQSVENLVLNKKKIGIALSGGIDSSCIAGIIRNLFPHRDIYTYSAGFVGDDEFEYARIVSNDLKTIHKERLVTLDDYFGDNSIIKDLILLQGYPVHPNEIPLALIEKDAVEDGCDIVLTGEGSDDIFGGYNRLLRMYRNYSHKIPFFNYFLNNYRYFSLEDRWIINPTYLVDDVGLVNNYINNSELNIDIRNWALYFIQKFHTTGLISRGQYAFIYNKLPFGFPFIDEKLVNYVNSLPFDFKINSKSDSNIENNELNYIYYTDNYDEPKYILKLLASKYINHNIIYRKKKGFPVPFDLWLKDINEWKLNSKIFTSNDISSFNGWKKFMLINLSIFADIFEQYIKRG